MAVRFTNSKIVESRNAGGGETSTALADATSFSMYFRLRLTAPEAGGTSYLWWLTNDANNHTGYMTAYYDAPNTRWQLAYAIWCNDGSADDPYVVSLPNLESDGAGLAVGSVVITGNNGGAGGTWRFKGRVNNAGVGYTTASYNVVAGLVNFGQAGEGCYCRLGTNFGTGSDFALEDFTVWKNYNVSDSDADGLYFGTVDVATLSAANQVIRLPLIGTDGVAADPTTDATWDNAGGHAAAPDFTFDQAPAGTGVLEYDASLAAEAKLALAFHIPEGGRLLAIELKADDPADEFTPYGTGGDPYAASLGTGLTYKVNGGSAVALDTHLYLRVNGPRFVIVPLPTPVTAGQTITVSCPAGWLMGKIDGQTAIHPAYTNEPVANHAGDPDSIVQALPDPADRAAMPVGCCLMEYPRVSRQWGPECFGVWEGTVTPDGEGGISASSGTVKLPLMAAGKIFRNPFRAWEWEHGPEVPHKLPPLVEGTYTLEWDGAFGSGNTVVDYGTNAPLGPYAGKDVSFWDFDVVAATENGAGAGRHRMTFTATHIDGTTGQATPNSVGGDDFVRPSTSYDCYPMWETGGGGARTNIALYPPGGTTGEVYDATTAQAFADARLAVVRVGSQLGQASRQSVPDLSYLKRYGDVDRTLASYGADPTYKTSVAVSEVANYTGGGWQDGLIPATHHGALLKITTATPHGLSRGTEVTVTGATIGSGASEGRIPIDDNGGGSSADDDWSANGLPWEGIKFVVGHVLSSTEIVAAVLWNNGLTANVSLTATVSSGLGSLSVPWMENRAAPEHLIPLICDAGAIPWLAIPCGFTDAAITAFAALAIAHTDADQEVWFEWGNEFWNLFFAGWRDTYSAMYGMPGSGAAWTAALTGNAVTGVTIDSGGSGYFAGYGGDGWYELVSSGGGGTGARVRAFFVNGVCVDTDIVAGGTGYTTPPTLQMPPHNQLKDFLVVADGQAAIAALMGNRVRKLVRAAWTAASRDPDKVKVVLAGQGENTGYMEGIVAYAEVAGFAVDAISGGHYDNMDAANNVAATTWNDGDLWRTFTDDQLADAVEIQTAFNDFAASVRSTRQYMNAHGMSAVPYVIYEAAHETLASGDLTPQPGGTPSSGQYEDLTEDAYRQYKLLYSPRMARLQWALLDQYRQAGAALYNHFQFGGDAIGAGSEGAVNQTWDAILQHMLPGKGDGTDGRADNTADPLNWLAQVSPSYWAFGQWNNTAAATAAPILLTTAGRRRRLSFV